MLNRIKKLLRPNILEFKRMNAKVQREMSALKLMAGKLLANQVRQHGIYENIHDAEFAIFSQFGDDGILQYLIHQTCPAEHTFIEFGVQNYTESNTRFLLMNNNWSGLIIDGSKEHITAVQSEELYWRFELNAVWSFVTCENINHLFRENGFCGEIGLLSIDIDGNDYWVWESIDTVSPTIVTIEYNSVFGPDHAITVPYNPGFVRRDMHYSNLYWGCSLKALCLLAEKKGYSFVGSNSNGNNAHFVRKDKLGDIPILTCAQGYVASKFRDSRDVQGNLNYLSGRQRLHTIKDMTVFNIEQSVLVRISDLFAGQL